MVIRLALRNIGRKPERSFLTAIGVLLAVAAAVSLLSVSEGLYTRLSAASDSQIVDLYVTTKGELPSSFGVPFYHFNGVPSPVVDGMLKNPEILSAAPLIQFFTRVNGENIAVIGFEPDKFSLFFPSAMQVEDGTLYDTAENTLVLGSELAEISGLTTGELITIQGTDFKITGVLGETGGFLDDYAYMSISNAARYAPGGYSEVWLQLKEQTKLASVRKEIAGQFPGLACETKDEYLDSAFSFIKMGRVLQWVIAVIGILIALAAAMNTMLMAAYERLREYGTLRALGASRGFVFALVMCESLMLSIAGGAIGLAVGALGANGVNAALGTLFQLSVPVTSVDAALLLEGFGLALLVGILGALIPAFIVSGADILKAVKGE